MFRGAYTALITPLRHDRLDEPALVRLVEQQLSAGIDGLVPCGTTGEASTLSMSEHLRVVELTVQTAAGRVPVLAGAAANDTRKAVELARACKQLGVAGLDTQFSELERVFLYLPFEHSESLADQDRCCELTRQLPNPQWADYADKHRVIIARFGRFPHPWFGQEIRVEHWAWPTDLARRAAASRIGVRSRPGAVHPVGPASAPAPVPVLRSSSRAVR